jgi:3-hydroxyacyl-[acyl-carrier-protein] dehydratase
MNNPLDRIQQKPPFLFIDRMLSVIPDQSITTLKRIASDEPYLAGHFPGHPIMPGVLILEGLLQSSALLATYSAKCTTSSLDYTGYVVSMNNIKFMATAEPEDVLMMNVRLIQQRSKLWEFEGTVHVEDKLTAQASWMNILHKNKDTVDV